MFVMLNIINMYSLFFLYIFQFAVITFISQKNNSKIVVIIFSLL